MSIVPLEAGSRITTSCSRCGDATGHVIIAMVNGEIIKVQCQACGSEHKYHAPKSAKKLRESVNTVKRRNSDGTSVSVADVSASRSEAARKAADTRAVARAAKEAAQTTESWMIALGKVNTDDPKPYSMKESYAKGDVMSHPTFGMGRVEEVTPPNKVSVLFRQGIKVLRCTL